MNVRDGRNDTVPGLPNNRAKYCLIVSARLLDGGEGKLNHSPVAVKSVAASRRFTPNSGFVVSLSAVKLAGTCSR
jgi:hypothetical protein